MNKTTHKKTDNWIWLPKNIYPENQQTNYSGFNDWKIGNYTVCEIKKSYCFDEVCTRMSLRFSTDTEFQLFLNGEIVATGPAFAASDYNLGNDKARPSFYCFETEIPVNSKKAEFFARVKMMPVRLCEYSKGHGGFMLSGNAYFEDGKTIEISSGEDWKIRKNGAYKAPFEYDARILPDEFVSAEAVEDIWNAEAAPIPIRCEEEILPENGEILLAPGEIREIDLELDKIYSGFLHIRAKTDDVVHITAYPKEIDEDVDSEKITFSGDGEYRGFLMHSAGRIKMCAENKSERPSSISVGFIFTHYPTPCEARTVTDDAKLNDVLDTCRHTLKICRQTMHLDSPRHQEPLACTGDYYIETLMTAFSFGDMRLAKFDVLRTAELLRNNNGRMFHTSYSLIWVKMLWDVYMLTGDKELLENCRDALDMLLERFAGYLGENGILETSPDYMFIDWLYIDGLSMHHPPKALGQTCLNMFYFEALKNAEKIYAEIGFSNEAAECGRKYEKLGCAVNELLFDEEKGLYFEGLGTETKEELIGDFMPQNVDKRYYLKHSNILAAYTGICTKERARELIRKIMTDECPGDYQPYFAHYLFEAIYKNGLREEYTLALAEKWKKPVSECKKGLVEGFLPPEPGYGFDHSHAWGGTPLWSLPLALCGLEINKPGFEEITLNPSSLGLKCARVEIPTRAGMIVCEIADGKDAKITHPAEIKVNLKKS